jgi:hypothetical protein
MATHPNSVRPGGGGALNLGVAMLAACALGFLAFAMPDDLFSTLVAQSGLPGFVEAAQPPLGMKARGAAIAAAAILTFLVVLLMLRGIDRLTARPAGAKARDRALAPEAEADAPRVRRADSHPDAPTRRPLLAGRDLADFHDEDEFGYPPDDMFADLPTQPLPGFLVEQQPVAEQSPEPEEAHAPVAGQEEEEEAEPLILETPYEEAGPEAEPFQDETPYQEVGAETEPAEDETPHRQVRDVAEPIVAEERSVEALVARLPETEESGRDNITSLMQRLESGLAQREIAEEEPEAMESVPEAEAMPVVAAPETPSWLAPQPHVAEAEQPFDETEVEADEGAPLHFPSLHASPPAVAEAAPVAAEPVAEQSSPAWVPPRLEAVESFDPPSSPAVEPPPQPMVDEFGELRCAPRRSEKKMVALPTDPPPAVPDAPVPPAAQTAPAEPAPQPIPEPDYLPMPETQVGHRLRNAIGEMNRMAGRGG